MKRISPFWKKVLIFLLGFNLGEATSSTPQDKQKFLLQEDQSILNSSNTMIPFYKLGQNEFWHDITSQVLDNTSTTPLAKKEILSHHRHIVVFKYPSDGLWIKGFVSFTPCPIHHPLLVLFRTGNQNFALFNPGVEWATQGDYTVLSSTLRGGVSEGKDEFGGADVDDMKNLIEFLPTLAKELGVKIQPPHTYLMGPSRGGLEMFLTLARYPGLQTHVDKIVALSAILDLHQQIRDRPNDMGQMFHNFFGLGRGASGEAWIKKRDPIETVPSLRKDLPILIIQGTNDPRINVAEGQHMVQVLHNDGHQVNYWEVKGGNHTLTNDSHLMDDVIHWLEAPVESSNVK